MSSSRTLESPTARASENALLVFLKYPTPGAVKTRLGPELTPEQAADFYRALAEDVLQINSRSTRYQTIVCFAPAGAHEQVRSWLGREVALQEQCGDDLGARQFDALRRALQGGFRKAVLIGTDCPTITPADVEAAFDALEESDVVIGPAEDGGYYLIGSRRPLRSIFEGISWSTEKVLGETTARIEKAGLGLRLLGAKSDIDSYEDLERFYRSIRDGSRAVEAGRSLEVMSAILGGVV
jgi:rSAM/selenodomain-associated transferase 1